MSKITATRIDNDDQRLQVLPAHFGADFAPTTTEKEQPVSKIEIKCRFSGSVIFAHEAEGNTLKITLEAAVKAGANLTGAYLDRANLTGADLAGTNLTRAYLAGANLAGTYLAGADLNGANLTGAYLTRVNLAGGHLAGGHLAGANLTGAYLAGANLAGANLAGTYLTGADLTGAYLAGADLTGTDLTGTDLAGANLTRANLDRANLDRANLAGANLAGTYLTGAYLGSGEELVGERPIFQIGPIGSRCAYFVAYLTDKGLRLDAGCQRQITREVFERRLANKHGNNAHAEEYRAALALIDAHAELWTPKEDREDAREPD